jgi:hypothetical protein
MGLHLGSQKENDLPKFTQVVSTAPRMSVMVVHIGLKSRERTLGTTLTVSSGNGSTGLFSQHSRGRGRKIERFRPAWVHSKTLSKKGSRMPRRI